MQLPLFVLFPSRLLLLPLKIRKILHISHFQNPSALQFFLISQINTLIFQRLYKFNQIFRHYKRKL